MLRYVFGIILLLVLIIACNGGDDAANPAIPGEQSGVKLVNAFPNLSFNQPLDLQSPPDDSNRIFVAEKLGLIKVFSNSAIVADFDVFLDLSNVVATDSEQGLLGLAFHPNYATNGFFYVHYNPNNTTSRIARFTALNGSNTASIATEQIVMEFSQPFTNHNGGQLAFGPDGFLYLSVGDGGSGGDPQNNAQNRANLLGSILRIDVDQTANDLAYAIPEDNPFVGQTGIRPEIYAYGLRNPWRMSFDTDTGSLWVADVGQNRMEEINEISSGGNYGWKLFEGTSCFSGDCNTANLQPPVFAYNQNNGDRSVTGGYVYRGEAITTLKGKYIYADFVSGRVWSLALDGSNNTLIGDIPKVASFGTDTQEELYLCSFNGTIYRFEEVGE